MMRSSTSGGVANLFESGRLERASKAEGPSFAVARDESGDPGRRDPVFLRRGSHSQALGHHRLHNDLVLDHDTSTRGVHYVATDAFSIL